MSVPARPATTTTPRSEGVTAVPRDAGGTVPEGERTVVRVDGVRVGGAGTKGFGGGFAGRGGSEFGEPEMNAFVRGTRGLADGLRRPLGALARDGCAVRIALTRFSPVPDTLVGAPLEIHPFLGGGPPAGAVDGSGADLAVPGHAHLEPEHGITSGGMRVRDVAQPVVRRAFAVNRLPVHPDRTTRQERSQRPLPRPGDGGPGLSRGTPGVPQGGVTVPRTPTWTARREALMPWRRRWGTAAATVLLLVTGCGSVDQRRTAALGAALGFERALGAEDGVAVCAVLAPGVRDEVEQAARMPCAQAVLEEEVPFVAAAEDEVDGVDVSGRQARVVFATDTLFLSRFSGGWKVVAAGCVPRPERPYRCLLKGG